MKNELEKTPTNNKGPLSPLSIIVALTSYMLGSMAGAVYMNNEWEKTLVNKGYAEYHCKTKQWNLCSPDEIVVNANDRNTIGDVPFGIDTASAYIKYLLSELKNYKQLNEILEKQLFEKETLLEKHKPKK